MYVCYMYVHVPSRVKVTIVSFNFKSIINNDNWIEWSAIWYEIIHSSDFKIEGAVWVQFEITSRPKLHNTKFNCHFITSIFDHLGKYQYFIDAVVSLLKPVHFYISISKTEKDAI